MARDFRQHGKWSMATFCRRLRQLNIKYIKKERSTNKVKDALKKELNGLKAWVRTDEPETSNGT